VIAEVLNRTTVVGKRLLDRKPLESHRVAMRHSLVLARTLRQYASEMSTMRQHIKERALRLSYRTGLDRLFARVYGGLGAIFCLHRVTSGKDESLARQLTVTADFLDQVIRHFIGEGKRFASIGEVESTLLDPERTSGPFIALTFDDGYRDNLTNALPILRKHGISATIYVPSGVPDRSFDPWWLRLEEAVLARAELKLDWPGLPLRIPTATFAEKAAAYALLTHYVHCDITKNRAIAALLLPKTDVSDESLVEDHFLGWSELRELACDPLVTIGAHTVSHPALSSLEEAQALDEMTRGRDRLVSELDIAVEHFAYPYGTSADCGAREISLARRAGFGTAVTLRSGNIFPRHRDHLTCLPRLSLGGARERIQDPVLDVSGAPLALGSRWRDPVVTL